MPPQKKTDSTEPTLKSSKQELLDAYHEILEQLQQREKAQLRPEQRVQERKEEKVLTAVAGLSADGAIQQANLLKQEMAKTLSELGERLAAEVNRFIQVQQAIQIKEKDLKEIYDIERAAGSLAALIEAHRVEKDRTEAEMAEEKAELTREIDAIRQQWTKEKAERDAKVKEQQEMEAKQRKRQEEEYRYAFERERQLAKDKFEDEKAKLLAEKQSIEGQMKALKEQTEKSLQAREQAISQREAELASLQAEVQAFPKRLDATAAAAVKESGDRLRLEAKYEKDLLLKQFEGEKNVLTARIQSFDKAVKEQAEQLAKLSQQQEAAYQKVQDVAVKAIEGASKVGSFAGLVHTLKEQVKKQTSED
jgi:hypothetical protein